MRTQLHSFKVISIGAGLYAHETSMVCGLSRDSIKEELRYKLRLPKSARITLRALALNWYECIVTRKDRAHPTRFSIIRRAKW